MVPYNHYFQRFFLAVAGTGYTIDSVFNLCKYGISTTLSLVDDRLIELARKYYYGVFGIEYKRLKGRAERITAYLNLINRIVNKQIAEIKSQSFDDKESDLTKYFHLLPPSSKLKEEYSKMMECTINDERIKLQSSLREQVRPGSIDVNIMTKLDNYKGDKRLESDAVTALKGYAESDLCFNTAMVFSAGLNMVLYGELVKYKDFFIKPNGEINKRIILKVSDYGSAYTQGKFLARKGIWVSEFRIESGLNCGGHAFPTDGELLGPILEEFRKNKASLCKEFFLLMNKKLAKESKEEITSMPLTLITAQGGVATAKEHRMLLDYGIAAVGYASLFLLVPEATSVDEKTLTALASSSPEDYEMDIFASPMDIPFQNFKKSSSQKGIKEDVEKEKAALTPCPNGFLINNEEFGKKLCTASSFYKEKKVAQLIEEGASRERINEILAKECICYRLGNSFLITKKLLNYFSLVSMCSNTTPAFFKGPYSLEEMLFHIYGKIDLLEIAERPHMFITELSLYVQYMEKKKTMEKEKLLDFYSNLCKGIGYYILWAKKQFGGAEQDKFLKELAELNMSAAKIFLKRIVKAKK